MGPHQGRAEGEETLPQPTAHTPLDAPQDPIGLLGNQMWISRKVVRNQKPMLTKHKCKVLRLGRKTKANALSDLPRSFQPSLPLTPSPNGGLTPENGMEMPQQDWSCCFS